ncbi:unnamed protein product [Fraxinus pennsylvanica]|uniref:Oberon-like PHD finger domain-containing protein n=1 Tax=Fraxinus pennsylvanica TaxID=56036 RepID=A0AAD1ZF20_9LAMI|nr:unnamed protein product [Fraxinus pennsylvanica]
MPAASWKFPTMQQRFRDRYEEGDPEFPVVNSFILFAKKSGGKCILPREHLRVLRISLLGNNGREEPGSGDPCCFSCHIECALLSEKVGVVNLGQLMQLDGGYCCASCGRVSGIIWEDLKAGMGQEQICGGDIRKCSGDPNFLKPDTVLEDRLSSIPRVIDLNVSPVPYLNEEFTPPVESSRNNWNSSKP